MRITLDSFVGVVERSDLIDAATLKSALAQYRSETTSPDARGFAEFLCRKELLTVWQAEKLLQGKHRGFSLGRYRLLALLGKGGMSSVYLAEHTVMKRRCAVKVLPTRKSKNAAYLNRFHREARAVAMLDHPNIVRAFDIDQALDGTMEIHFLVMEYVSGKTLFEQVKTNGPLPVAKAIDSIRQAALGLDHAHKSGLIHRDVKPENLIIDRQGVLKVMDLGLARFFQKDEDEQITVQQDDRVLGTANYCSPEQAVDSHLVDARTDIYSLGCTLYYLLTGQPPFNSGTLAQRLLAHQTKEPPPVESKRPDVPPELTRILNRMMAKDPAARFQSAAEVAEALDTFSHSKAGVAASTRVPPPETTPPAVPAADTGDVDLFKEFEAAFREPAESETDPNEASLTPGGSEPSAIELFFEQMSDPNSASDSAVHPGGKAEPSDSKASAQRRSKDAIDIVASSPGSPRKSATTIKKLEAPVAEPPAATGPTPRKAPALWIGIGIAGVLALAAGLVALMVPGMPQRPVATANDTELRVGPAGHFASVTEAVDAIVKQKLSARTIRIAAGSETFERLVLNEKTTPALKDRLTIIGDGIPVPILRPVPGGGPIAKITGISNLTIEGIRFSAAGAENAIHLSSFFANGRFANLTIDGFERTGIDAQNASGFLTERLTLDNVILRGTNDKAVGIRWNASAGDRVSDVEFRNLRVLGPMAVGIEFAGRIDNVRIESSIFHQTDVALRFAQASQVVTGMVLVNNTFSGCRLGIAFAGLPGPGSEPVRMFHNLFVSQKGHEATIEAGLTDEQRDAKPPEDIARSNWSDRLIPDSKQEDGLNIFENGGKRGISTPEFFATDPIEPDFLRPKPGQLGVEKDPDGNGASYVGAISP